MQPIISGAQISRFSWCRLSPWMKASIRLTAKASVPAKRTKVASQSSRIGSYDHQRQRSPAKDAVR